MHVPYGTIMPKIIEKTRYTWPNAKVIHDLVVELSTPRTAQIKELRGSMDPRYRESSSEPMNFGPSFTIGNTI